ncbi:hypothetical protein L6164_034569 [Bauhinia variegata]|uniref:Uncharacterized protein n=1 Tax=Bauhinia variegata TaxID=167791 RepID=A0ACB9KVU7_BAUVA|nr:hypothetical protein L6164_034569 [Bauhinia variegata]
MASNSGFAVALPEIQTRKRKQSDDQKEYKHPSIRRRKDTLFKKSRELAIKGDAQVCLICIDPNGDIDVFPEPKEAKAMLHKYVGTHDNKNNDQIDKIKREADQKKALLNLLNSKLEILDERIQKMSNEASYSCKDFEYWNSFPPLLDDLDHVLPSDSISPSFNAENNIDDGVLLQELLGMYGIAEYNGQTISWVPEIGCSDIPLLEWDNASHVAGIGGGDRNSASTRTGSETVQLQQTAVPVEHNLDLLFYQV